MLMLVVLGCSDNFCDLKWRFTQALGEQQLKWSTSRVVDNSYWVVSDLRSLHQVWLSVIWHGINYDVFYLTYVMLWVVLSSYPRCMCVFPSSYCTGVWEITTSMVQFQLRCWLIINFRKSTTYDSMFISLLESDFLMSNVLWLISIWNLAIHTLCFLRGSLRVFQKYASNLVKCSCTCCV